MLLIPAGPEGQFTAMLKNCAVKDMNPEKLRKL